MSGFTLHHFNDITEALDNPVAVGWWFNWAVVPCNLVGDVRFHESGLMSDLHQCLWAQDHGGKRNTRSLFTMHHSPLLKACLEQEEPVWCLLLVLRVQINHVLLCHADQPLLWLFVCCFKWTEDRVCQPNPPRLQPVITPILQADTLIREPSVTCRPDDFCSNWERLPLWMEDDQNNSCIHGNTISQSTHLIISTVPAQVGCRWNVLLSALNARGEQVMC